MSLVTPFAKLTPNPAHSRLQQIDEDKNLLQALPVAMDQKSGKYGKHRSEMLFGKNILESKRGCSAF
jgi:hypothetical protein